MSDVGNSDLFDAYYFAHSCGRPYQRNEHWLGFFGTIAEKIVNEVQPQSVMDVGCAMGFLVEALRERNVEAFGIDISEFAIGEIGPEIKPFCWVASVLDPFPRDYDLMVCIEVLEHLKPEEADRAVSNLCKYSTQVLFSSTPSDFKEATHFNVQPPHYWSEHFARHGFYRDLDFDASFITPWAMLFKSEKVSTARVVKNYDRQLWQLQQEIAGLRSFSLEVKSELVDHENLVAERADLEARQQELLREIDEASEQIRELRDQLSIYQKIATEKEQLEVALEVERNQVETLQDQLRDQEELAEKQRLESLLKASEVSLRAEKERTEILANEKFMVEAEKVDLGKTLDALSKEKQVIQGRLAEHEAHVGWRLVTKVQRFRIRLFPVGSPRERIWKAGVAFFRAWLDLGFWGAIRKALSSVRGKPIGHTIDSDYQKWIKVSEPSPEDLHEQRTLALSFSYRPLISVVTPVYNPPLEVLKEALESILDQTYDRWEMCIADASTNSGVRHILDAYSKQNSRIKVRFMERNEGIAENSNQALDLASGEFIAIFDHDDRLAPNTFFEVVHVLNEDQDVDILYFDEDKLSSDGKERRDPWFKPDWSPELLLSANFLMHSVVRRELVQEVDGFRKSMEGTQDWDLLFRCTEKTKRIRHIPKVLYHWRQIKGSAASDLLAKPWVFENQRKCVQEHLERIGLENANATFTSPGFLRVSWSPSESLVSIVIPSKDKVEVLQRCIDSLLKITDYPHYEIILVDNESVEKNTIAYYESLKDDSRVKFIPFPGEFNFSAANNQGAREANGKLLLFLNNDVEILEPDWLEEMVRWAERPEIGVVGAKLLYPNGLIQHAGVVIGMQGHASHVFMGSMEKQTGPFGSVDWYRDYSAVTGACMMMRKEVFEEIGGFDEGYQLVFSDVEICLRVVNKGYRVVYTPYARLRHYEGKSRGVHIPASDMLRGYEHMHEWVEAGDRYFNPNLSYAIPIPSIQKCDEESRLQRLENLVGINHQDENTLRRT
jgi:GT2 family glycosyltransferase